MPIFEFKCDQCGHQVEKLQKHDDPPPVCEPCDETLPAETPFMVRQVSRSSFTLKGSGWAFDGYAGGAG